MKVGDLIEIRHRSDLLPITYRGIVIDHIKDDARDFGIVKMADQQGTLQYLDLTSYRIINDDKLYLYEWEVLSEFSP